VWQLAEHHSACGDRRRADIRSAEHDHHDRPTIPEPAGIAALKACRDATPVDLPVKVAGGTAVLQHAIEACGTDAQFAVDKLTGPGVSDVGYAMLTFSIELDRAKINLDGGTYDKVAETVFATAVLTFLTAVAKYLDQ
jgi:hypothetical protein